MPAVTETPRLEWKSGVQTFPEVGYIHVTVVEDLD